MKKHRSNLSTDFRTVQNFGTPEKRKIMRQHTKDFWEWKARQEQFMEKTGLLWPDFPEPIPVFPEEIRGMMCGAKNRKGTPCKQLNLFNNGRCKFHGGASTGPRTRKGKTKSARNGFKRKTKRTS